MKHMYILPWYYWIAKGDAAGRCMMLEKYLFTPKCMWQRYYKFECDSIWQGCSCQDYFNLPHHHQESRIFYSFTTPTRAGLSVLPCSLYPTFSTTATVPFSLSGKGIWNNASWLCGSNFSSSGYTFSKPFFLKTFCNWASVIRSPSYKFFRWVFLSISSLGTVSVAFPNMSATSSRSLEKAWIPNSLASSTCFLLRDSMFSLSARERLYLSWDRKVVS